MLGRADTLRQRNGVIRFFGWSICPIEGIDAAAGQDTRVAHSVLAHTAPARRAAPAD